MNTKLLTSKSTQGKFLDYNPKLSRNYVGKIITGLAILFTLISILPLIFIISYIVLKGASLLNLTLFTQLPEPPGDDLLNAGGIGNAITGTFIVTSLASVISIPIGIGGGIFLAEYSRNGNFSRFIRFGTNILAGVPSIISGVVVYGVIVSTKIIMGSKFSALAGGIALSILMLPTIIKTTDEALKLVPNDLRRGALGVGASKYLMITRITLPTAINSIATGILLAVARAAGETAPLIFTALFSFYWSNNPQSLLEPIATLSVLIYNFALEPYKSQNDLAWVASFVLVLTLLALNIFARWLSKFSSSN